MDGHYTHVAAFRNVAGLVLTIQILVTVCRIDNAIHSGGSTPRMVAASRGSIVVDYAYCTYISYSSQCFVTRLATVMYL